MNGHLHLSVNLNNEVEIKYAINILEIFYNQAYSKDIPKMTREQVIEHSIPSDVIQEAVKSIKKENNKNHKTAFDHVRYSKNQYGTFPRKIKVKEQRRNE